MEFPDTVRAIATSPGAWCPSLSPSGDQVAYITDRSGLPRLEIADTATDPMSAHRLVSAAGEEAVSVAWSPDGQWLAYLISPGGSIRAQLRVVRPDGSDRKTVAGGGELETVFAGLWTSRPGQYAFSLADGRGPDACVWVADVQTGHLEPLSDSQGLGFCTVTAVSADGNTVIVRCGPRNQRRLLLMHPSSSTKPITSLIPVLHWDFPHGGDVGEDGRFAPDGRSVLLRTSAGRDRVALVRVPLDDEGRPGAMTIVAERADADLEGYAVRPDGYSAVLVWNANGRSVCEIRNLETGTSCPVELPQPVMPGWSLHPDGQSMVVEVTGPTAPRSLLHLTLPAPKGAPEPAVTQVRRISGMPLVALPDTVVIPTSHHFRSLDGLELQGWLYRPGGVEGPTPTVISFHGGPESQERPAFALLNQSLVAAGFTVFAPNVRGSSGFGSAFQAADDGAARVDSLQDVPATVRFLVDEGWAEATRIGVQGWSYGGYLALTALSQWPDLFAAGSTHAGMSDLLSFFAETETWMAAASVTEYGDPGQQEDLLRVLSPLTHLSQVRSPTLMLHGDQDTNVPVGESIRAHVALRNAGVPTELLLLPGEGHTIVGAGNRAELALAVCSWFERWLVQQ